MQDSKITDTERRFIDYCNGSQSYLPVQRGRKHKAVCSADPQLRLHLFLLCPQDSHPSRSCLPNHDHQLRNVATLAAALHDDDGKYLLCFHRHHRSCHVCRSSRAYKVMPCIPDFQEAPANNLNEYKRIHFQQQRHLCVVFASIAHSGSLSGLEGTQNHGGQ